MVADAFRRALPRRVGFEDSVVLPNGRRASSNAELVATAVSLRSEIRGAAGRDPVVDPGFENRDHISVTERLN